MSVEPEPRTGYASGPNRRRPLVLEVLTLCGTHLTGILRPLLGIKVSWIWSLTNPDAIDAVIGEVPRLGLYLFVMYASGDPLSRFGLRRVDWRRDLIALGLALLVLTAYCGYELPRPLTPTTLRLLTSVAGRLAPVWLLAIKYLLVGAYEETAYRGYMIPRLEELLGSTWIAVIVQGVFFGLVHSYQGLRGMVVTGLFGLGMGTIFARYRSVWPLALAHALNDFILTVHTIQAVS
jgi:membrane protease YdiL (CAAX protease family)